MQNQSIDAKKLDKLKHQFVTGGDWNTVFEDDTQLLDFGTKNTLIDVMYNLNGLCDLPTYVRGNTKLNYPLISDSLKGTIRFIITACSNGEF